MRILAILILFILAPLVLLISILLYATSGPKVIFKQNRVGFGKKEFVIYKFKTMEDGNITTIGKVLRKLGLDEIPQLVNIAKNDMAFIGPRPLTAFDIDRLGWNKSEYLKRWSVKPGITGLAQLTNVCDANASMQNDLKYVAQKGLLLDTKIIIKTMLVPIVGKHTA